MNIFLNLKILKTRKDLQNLSKLSKLKLSEIEKKLLINSHQHILG